MAKLDVLIGRRFGRLFVTAQAVNDRQGKPQWECVCDCGRRTVVRGYVLRKGDTLSCKCLRKELSVARATIHGHRAGIVTRTYSSWHSMRMRCSRPGFNGYERYGAVGITVCKRWNKFENFLADMGERPAGTSIERIKNDKGYAPDNCCWATLKQQGRNRTNNVMLSVGTLTQCSSAWAEELGGDAGIVNQRLRKGWPVEAACTLPPKRRGAK